MLGFLKKKAPKWEKLSDKQKSLAAFRMASAMRNAKAYTRGYKVVDGPDVWNREQGFVEHQSEDGILDWSQRGRMLDLARNVTRNSPTFNSLLKQLDYNVCGIKGGKVIISFEDKQVAEDLKRAFKKFTRQADFFDGLSFNSLLKLILKTYIIGGDMVLMFDDNFIDDSGKILLYEPDEIGSVPDEALKSKYGKDASQSLGRVYDINSRFIGVVVSRSQRGQQMFDESKCFFLRQDPDSSMFDNYWLMPRNVFRVAQGRGISPLACSLPNTIDLEDLCTYELQAAKKNAQTLASVTQQAIQSEEQAPSTFSVDDIAQMTDEQIEDAMKQEQSYAQQTMTLDKITAAGCIYQVIPENYKLELLDTKRPNPNLEAFIHFLAARTASSLGIAEQYSTLMANGTDYRAQQLISKPAFDECKKFLENICDWVLWRFVKWADRKGIFDASKLPDDWMSDISWAWADTEELDEVQYQTAIEKKLQNHTASYRQILGPDWRKTLEQIKEEVQWFNQNGMLHPSLKLISGGESQQLDTTVQIEEERDDI